MNNRKRDVIKALKERGIDPVRLERELVSMLRRGSSSIEISSRLREIVGGKEA